MSNPPQTSNHLPFDARAALIRASQIKDPMLRRAAIDAARAMAAARFPHLFKKP